MHYEAAFIYGAIDAYKIIENYRSTYVYFHQKWVRIWIFFQL